jgi:predicted nucleic acid-binding protein
MKFVLDSTVFVDAVTKSTYQLLCLDLLKAIALNPTVILYEPTLVLFELIDAVERNTQVPKDRKERVSRATTICHFFINRKNTHFINLDIPLWIDWSSSSQSKCTHKTQDEIFLDVATQSNAYFVSSDKALLEKPRCRHGQCKVLSPYRCLRMINDQKTAP